MNTPEHAAPSVAGVGTIDRPVKSRPVYVVDDDPDMRESIHAILDAEQYETKMFASGTELLESTKPSQASCIVLDLRLNDMSGLDVMRGLCAREEHCPPIVFVTGHGDVQTAVSAMKNPKVIDFIEKPFAPARLLELVGRSIDADRKWRNAEDGESKFREKLATLSPREREVLDRLARGDTNKAISIELELSPKTVATHRANILQKFGESSILDVIYPMRRLGLV